jgi:hypothetical protein
VNQPRSFRDHREVGDDLGSSLLRIGRLQERGELRCDAPSGWLRCDELLANPARFADWRARLATWLVRNHGAAPERTTAGYVMSWYLHVPAYVGALLLHHERRVPSLKPEQLAFGLGEDRPDPVGMAVLSNAFYCLPTDPGSAREEATVVADERALAGVLRAEYLAAVGRGARRTRQLPVVGRPPGRHAGGRRGRRRRRGPGARRALPAADVGVHAARHGRRRRTPRLGAAAGELLLLLPAARRVGMRRVPARLLPLGPAASDR